MSALSQSCRKGHDVRVQVEVFLEIPQSFVRGLNKRTLRSREVVIKGANWPKAYLFCRRCGIRLAVAA